MTGGTTVTIIGGCGHVGLPLGLIIASIPNFQVRLLDIDEDKIAQINSGKMPFWEDGMDSVLARLVNHSLYATSDLNCLRDSDVVITVIGTPVDRHLNPLLNEIHRHADETIDRMKENALLIMRSTLYPGVTKLIYDRIQFKKRKIHLAVCPERIMQNRAIYEIPELPQIVGAFEKEAEKRAGEFFKKITKTVIYVTPLEAEFGKLMTNSWRYLDFAIANQFYILCQRFGMDFYRIFEAYRYDYPRMSIRPKAGFSAGPCLLKDTLQLCAFSNNLFTLGSPAMVVNESLPNFIIEQLQSLTLSERRVAILGMAFKGNCDDKRDSLAYKLRNLLLVYAKEVLCTDPYVLDDTLVPLDTALKADIIILGAPHSDYADLRFSDKQTVVDVFGFWPRTKVSVDTSGENGKIKSAPVLLKSPTAKDESSSLSKKIPWWQPQIGQAEYELVKEVLDSNYLNEGAVTEKFEKELATLFGVKNVVAVTSGTAALFLSLYALGVRAGDEVIVPDLTFIATANAVTMAGAKVVLVDVDPNTLTMDPTALVGAITPRTKAIIPVHVSGRASDMAAIMKIASQHNIPVVEDSTEAFMCFHKGKVLGTYGALGCFSFSPNKTITTGQGGLILINDESLVTILKQLKDQGRAVRGTGGDDLHPVVGFNFKFTNLQAAIGLAQLQYLDTRLKRMQQIYRLYHDRLSGLEGIKLIGFDIDGGETPLWIDAIVEERDKLDKWLTEKNMDCRRLWHPLHSQNPYLAPDINFPHSTVLSKKALWLPSAFTISDQDFERVCQEIKQFLKQHSASAVKS